MKCTVFYESWQMECCGTAFTIGDRVKWLVYKIEREQILTPVELGTIDYCYDEHNTSWEVLFVLEGRVKSIKVLYELFRPEADPPQRLVSIGGKLLDSEKAEGFEEEIDDMKSTGYVVVLLDECSIRHSEQREVTFR